MAGGIVRVGRVKREPERADWLVASVMGTSSWPAAWRRISNIRVARLAPVETNAA